MSLCLQRYEIFPARIVRKNNYLRVDIFIISSFMYIQIFFVTISLQENLCIKTTQRVHKVGIIRRNCKHNFQLKAIIFSLCPQHYYSHMIIGSAFLVFSFHFALLDASFSKTSQLLRSLVTLCVYFIFGLLRYLDPGLFRFIVAFRT